MLIYLLFIGIFTLSEALNLTDLHRSTKFYVESHFREISEEAEFLDLRYELILKLLSSEHLYIDNEREVSIQ